MPWEAAQQWLADLRLVRRLVDTISRSRSRRRLAALDHHPPGRAQFRALAGLLHRARGTRFGRDHDFRRTRTAADYRRLVPLCTPADLWHAYWHTAYPRFDGLTWPGPVACLATPADSAWPLPVSPALWASHRAAAWTALACVVHARPRAHLFAGRFLFLGDGAALTPLAGPAGAGTLEAAARREMPPLLRPYTVGVPDGIPDPDPLQTLAVQSARLPVTCVAGEAGRLLRFFARLKDYAARDHVTEVWPGLAAVLFTRGPSAAGRAELAEALGAAPGGAPVLLLEACVRPEASVAVEDPRHGLLRLLPDHGVFFEFVPEAEVGRPQPTRHTIAEVEPGVPYAVAVTSPAGLWACLVGLMVRFERRDPPLLHLVEAAAPAILPAAEPSRTDAAVPQFPVHPPHPHGAPAPLPAAFAEWT